MSAFSSVFRRLFPLLFLILAACSGGNNDSTSVSDPAAAAPTITSFTAAQPATSAGRPVTLSWVVTGATSLLLQPGAIDVSARTSIDVTPTATTTYTLQATNGAGSVQATSAIRTYDFGPIGTTLDSFVADSGPNTVTGYAFIAFDKTGTLYSRAAGDESVDSVRVIASGTKLPSVTAILTLVDSGVLNLDVPVAQYLAADRAFNWPIDKQAITMRMLLAHTSGLIGLSDEQPDCLSQQNSTLRLCAQIIANTDLIATPGTTFNYGAVDFQVAGYIATLLSGQSWQDFFNTSVGSKLGFTAFSYGDGGNPRIAGGAVTNIADYAVFLRMILNGGTVGDVRVLSTAMIAELKRDEVGNRPIVYTPFPADRQANYPQYGLGVFLTAPALFAPSPGPEYSSPGLFGAIPWFDDGLGYGAVLLVTDLPSTGLNMWDAVRPQIISQLRGPTS